MRLLFLLASAVCAFIAAGIGFRWDLFDLDNPYLRDDLAGWGWLAVTFASLGLVWDDLATLAADLFGPIRRRSR